MLGNKDLKESINELKELVSKLDSKIEDKSKVNHQKIEDMKSKLEQVQTENFLFDERLKEELEELKSIKQNFESEIKSFLNLKDNIKKNLMDDFKKNIEREVKTINDETVKYFELKKEINDSHNTLKEFNENIKKLNNISKNIQEADFDLTKHYGNIDKSDKEKIRLEKEVDRLQGIIAKWKRRS